MPWSTAHVPPSLRQMEINQQKKTRRDNVFAEIVKTIRLKRCTASDTFFLINLSAYLKTRAAETDGLSENVLSRCRFVLEICTVMQTETEENTGLIEKLNEKNIVGFKGFFSKRLYQILSDRRESLVNGKDYSTDDFLRC